MKTKLANYNAHISWDDEVTSPSAIGTISLPDGTTATVKRVSHQSVFKTPGGPFSTGGTHYLFGDARFEQFDDLMQKGLGLSKIRS